MKKFLSGLLMTALVSLLTLNAALTAFAQLGPNADELRALEYTDVDESELYLEGIGYLSNEGVLTGDPEGTFRPLDTLNRAEMVKIIVETTLVLEQVDVAALQSTVDSFENTACFDDVPAGIWYEKYVCYAKNEGWVVGYDNNMFMPDQPVTFVEGLKITMEGLEIPYDADPEIWYRTVVQAAEVNNYIPFTIDGFNNDLLRDEMSDLITRILKDGMGELDMYLGNRSEVTVTYETIEAGTDLSQEPLPMEPMVIPPTSFDVTLTNTSDMVPGFEMPLSPGVVVAHDCAVPIVLPGVTANPEVESLAEWGDPTDVVNMLDGVAGVYAFAATDAPILPGESMTVQLEVDSELMPDACFSAAVMAVGTNDGIVTGVLTPDVEAGEGYFQDVSIYDMGTEENSDINSGFEGGQPDGTKTAQENMDAGTPTDPWAEVMLHPQFEGVDPIMTISGDFTPLVDDTYVTHVVEITETGFEPADLVVEVGEVVQWVNMDPNADHWPASAFHPTHTEYPGSDIELCGTLDELFIFDACVALALDDTYEFAFFEVGTWLYHDHLNPELTGSITVEEVM